MITRIAVLALLPLLAAAPESDGPVFSQPTQITNVWAPFVPGSVKVFRGRDEGVRTAKLWSSLTETRSFEWGGGSVECRVLQEQDFEDGALVEFTLSWLAQDDAGDVYVFGEVSWEVTDGTLGEAEGDSWLVGGATHPGDPPNVQDESDPHLRMGANPQIGDVYVLPAWPSGHETVTVLAKDRKVKVPAGKWETAMLVQELDDGEDGSTEKSWIVPGIGMVKASSNHGRDELLATSLVEATVGP